jgi:hypothetical protein
MYFSAKKSLQCLGQALPRNIKLGIAPDGEKVDPIGELVVCALNTTSISTFSAMLEAAKYGKNKEGDAMSQINLLMICENFTGIPLYYRSLPGNYSDKNVLDTTIRELRSAEFRKGTILVMDRGFYSQRNVVKLLKSNFRFLMGMPISAGIYKKAIREASEVILDTENFCEPAEIHAWSKVISIEAPRRGRGPNSHEVCLYLFLNPDKQAEEQQKYARRFSKGKALLEADPSLYGKGNFYGRHYVLERDASGKVIAVSHNIQAQREKMKECGFSSGTSDRWDSLPNECLRSHVTAIPSRRTTRRTRPG